MVVEDEPLIRMILVEELEEAGFEVTPAATADEAMRLLDKLAVVLRLLITDIHMPGGVSGLDLASYVRGRHPAVPILFTTGRPDVMTGAVTLGDNSFLIRKPYSAAEVLDRMRLLELQP